MRKIVLATAYAGAALTLAACQNNEEAPPEAAMTAEATAAPMAPEAALDAATDAAGSATDAAAAATDAAAAATDAAAAEYSLGSSATERARPDGCALLAVPLNQVHRSIAAELAIRMKLGYREAVVCLS